MKGYRVYLMGSKEFHDRLTADGAKNLIRIAGQEAIILKYEVIGEFSTIFQGFAADLPEILE